MFSEKYLQLNTIISKREFVASCTVLWTRMFFYSPWEHNYVAVNRSSIRLFIVQGSLPYDNVDHT